MADTKTTKPVTKRPRRMVREPQTEALSKLPAVVTPAASKPQTKASLVEDLLQKADGASLDELCQNTGWLPHTCRAFLTGLRKKSRAIERSKREDGTTIYKLAAAKVEA